MLSKSIEQQTLSHPQASDLYATYGVRVNSLSVDAIFALYERTGFLYPEKAARLKPYMHRVKENWRRMLRAGESLMCVLTAEDEKQALASLAVWRTTMQGWMLEHLVSENNPFGSRAVMLASGAASILKRVDESGQNWFRPDNRFPARVFGSMVETVGGGRSSVQRHGYFAFPSHISLPAESEICAVPYDESHKEALCSIATIVRGKVYVTAEDLTDDVELKGVDELYRKVGLRRTRSVWLAYRKHTDEPVGAAIAYRGPLGINFSYLENRCDLLLSKTLSEAEIRDAAAALLSKCTAAYADFELDQIPVVADEIARPVLVQLGGEFLRHYCQGIWLKDGYPRFYRHVDAFYSKLLSRAERHAMQETASGSQW